MNDYRISQRRACAVLLLRRSTWFYKARRRDDSVLRKRIREIAETRVRYGCQRIFTLLRREGWRDNHKRVHRLYRLEGLNLRSKRPRRKRSAAHRLDRPELSSIHQCWTGPISMVYASGDTYFLSYFSPRATTAYTRWMSLLGTAFKTSILFLPSLPCNSPLARIAAIAPRWNKDLSRLRACWLAPARPRTLLPD